MRDGRWAPTACALVLALLLLGPASTPGYVLSYDMVWVPDLALTQDALGVGTGLPRAVPSDAVVALLDELVPGMLLQKLVLVGALVAGGAGAAALVPGLPVLARCAGTVAYVWSPFTVERLVLGHWPLLLTHAVLPWLLLALRRWRQGSAGRGWLLLVAVASLSAAGGVLSAVVVLVAGWVRDRPRRLLGPILLVLAVNAPWWVSGLLHVEQARSDPRGALVFALSDEGLLPGPIAALALGGIWNADVVPVSRQGAPAVVSLVVLVGLAVVALTSRRREITDLGRLTVLWSVGWVLAVLTWWAPDVVAALAATVPGGGLLRDGARALLVCAPLVAVLVAHGVDAVGARLPGRLPRAVVTCCLGLLPVALMPDAAAGVSGRLDAHAFPAGWVQAREEVEGPGDVLVLPFTSYRAPAWNGHHPVLDPLGRFLGEGHVADDRLPVDGLALAGEDPRAVSVARALETSSPEGALGRLGIRWVVVDTTAPGEVPPVEGTTRLAGDLRVVELAQWEPRRVPATWWWAQGTAWALLLAAVGWATAGLVRAARRRTWEGHGVGLRRRSP